MQPETMPTPPQNPTNPGVLGPAPSPSGGQFGGGSGSKKKLLIIIAASVAAIFLILIILAVVMSNDGTPTQEQEQQTPTVDPEGPQPATPLDVENTDNSITQDLSSLNDDNELPPDQLSDDNLNL